MVTLGSGDLNFSTGFDPEMWKQGLKQRYEIALVL